MGAVFQTQMVRLNKLLKLEKMSPYINSVHNWKLIEMWGKVSFLPAVSNKKESNHLMWLLIILCITFFCISAGVLVIACGHGYQPHRKPTQAFSPISIEQRRTHRGHKNIFLYKLPSLAINFASGNVDTAYSSPFDITSSLPKGGNDCKGHVGLVPQHLIDTTGLPHRLPSSADTWRACCVLKPSFSVFLSGFHHLSLVPFNPASSTSVV